MSHVANKPYKTFGKTSQFAGVSPAQIWVFIDEDAYSLNDGGFGFGMNSPEWIDFPGTYHNNGCGFAFADGHSEVKHWRDGTTAVVGGNVTRRAIPAKRLAMAARAHVRQIVFAPFFCLAGPNGETSCLLLLPPSAIRMR
jgi:prepilin-type processing-associated H-X9-DG protein